MSGDSSTTACRSDLSVQPRAYLFLVGFVAHAEVRWPLSLVTRMACIRPVGVSGVIPKAVPASLSMVQAMTGTTGKSIPSSFCHGSGILD